MPWQAKRGATLLIPSGPAHDPDRKHLHIVLTDPMPATGEVLLACVCSIPESNLYDGSCSFFPGEHDFIKKHSYVAFNRCRAVPAKLLEEKVQAHEFVAKDDLSDKRMDDVLIGFNDSPHVAPKIRRFFEAAS